MEATLQKPKQTTKVVLSEEDKKVIKLYGKQVTNSFVGENLSKKEKELLVGMALQAFEDGLIFNKKINTKK
jgi:hypothetical protein